MTSHNLRIHRDANTTLDSMIQQGILLPTNEKISGVSGQVYRIADGVDLSALDHFHLRVAEKIIPVNLYALPPEEYAGLLAAAPEFSQYRYAHLATALLRTMTTEQQSQWLKDVASGIEEGLRVDQTPRLLQLPTHPARWQPEGTRLSRAGCGWLLTLTFDDPQVDIIEGLDRSAAGVDVGLHHLTTTAFASGAVHQAPGVVDVSRLSPEQIALPISQREFERHLQLLQHAAARTSFQHLMLTLLSSASVVYLEDLRYDDMAEVFKERSRTLGIRDWMMGWLPQRLHAHDIPLERVRPDLTSQFCSTTHCRGERNGRDFLDGNGRMVDADLNAARNLLQIGLAQRISRELHGKNLKQKAS